MARITLPPELKKAISGLSPQEKDKLLFRLIAKDPALVEKLAFELLEGGDTQLQRREELAAYIRAAINNSVRYYYSPGYLLLDLRALSGEINRHVKTTKDKYGEIQLNFLMLNEALTRLGAKIASEPARRSRTLNNYVVKRAGKLLKLLGKLHPDYQLDFKSDMQQLGRHISFQENMMDVAVHEGVDVNCLLDGRVPEE